MTNQYVITVNRRGRSKDLDPMTMDELERYFGYTLEKGRSWQHEKGNQKIPKSFGNIDKFISAINACERNASLNGDPGVFYSLKQTIAESIVKEMDGSSSVLCSFPQHSPFLPFNTNGERCHAKIVKELPSDDFEKTGYESMGYTIYYDRKNIYKNYSFNPYAFCAIKESAIKESAIKESAIRKSTYKEGNIMSKIDAAVNSILEGKDITQALLGAGFEDAAPVAEESAISEETQPAYYEVVYGYFMSIVKMDAPTTDYGAVVDIVIDNLEAEGAEGLVMPLDQAEEEYQPDEYVTGGNHGMALITNGNFNIEEISEERANELNSSEHIDIYCESNSLEESGAGRLVSVRIVQEPYGRGVEVKDSNGAIYRYAVDEHDPKYFTPEKVMHAVQGIARRNNYDMGKIYNFLKTHTLGDYDKDVSGRAGLDKVEIVAEPNGEGLKITLDNGKVYRYTVNTEDEKYDSLEKLKDGAEGMWRHGASISGLLTFLDNHAILYAREAMEMFMNRALEESKKA